MYLVHFNPSTSLVVTHFSDAVFSPAVPDIYLQYYGDIYPVYDGSSTQFFLRLPSVDGRSHCHNPKSNEEGSVVRLQGQVRHGLYSNVRLFISSSVSVLMHL
jgi:UDP-3-O-acyl-N-acetylglucosamine deacetylase